MTDSAVYRLHVNTANVNLDAYSNTGYTVTDTLPAGWELMNFSGNDLPFYIYNGEGVAGGENHSVTANSSALTNIEPGTEPVAGKIVYSIENDKITFYFSSMDDACLIILKAGPTEDKLDKYFGQDGVHKEGPATNTAQLNVLDKTFTASQDVIVSGPLLDMSITGGQDKGKLVWTVDYKPCASTIDGKTEYESGDFIRDTLSSGLSFALDESGQLADLKIYETELTASGTVNTGTMKDVTADFLAANGAIVLNTTGAGQSVTFKFLKENQPYRFVYKTFVTGELNARESNTAALYKNGKVKEGVTENYNVSKKDTQARVADGGWLQLTKVDASRNAITDSPAKFELYTNYHGENPKVVRVGFTNAQGKLLFCGLDSGTYHLVESKAPNTFAIDYSVYEVIVAESTSGKFSASITGHTATAANEFEILNTKASEVGHLIITNSVNSAAQEHSTRDFVFTVRLSKDETALPVEDLFYMQNGIKKSFPADGRFTLKDGDSINIANIPVGSSYEVTEASSSFSKVITAEEGTTLTDGTGVISAATNFTLNFLCSWKGTTPTGSTPPSPTLPNDGVVTVDGKTVDAGKLTVDKNAGETVLTLDTETLADVLTSSTSGLEASFALDKETTSAVARISAEIIELMQGSGAALSIIVGDVQYSLPTLAIGLPALLEQLGTDDASDVTLDFCITPVADDATQDEAAQALSASGSMPVVPAMQFEIVARLGGKSVSLNRFSSYVTRTVPLTAEQAAQISTAVVIDANGKIRHVPTEISRKNGECFAEISSLTNSTYVLIYNKVSFPDIAMTWFEACVQEVGDCKIANGYPDGSFEGNGSITRAEFAQIIVNALGLPPDGNGAVFSNVSALDWYAGAVGTAYEYGLVSGKNNGLFDPQTNITRQEAMQVIRNAAKLAALQGESGSLDSFNDADSVAGWAETAVKFCVGSGLVSGHAGNLNPTDDISRAETSTIILRLLQEAGLIDKRSQI